MSGALVGWFAQMLTLFLTPLAPPELSARAAEGAGGAGGAAAQPGGGAARGARGAARGAAGGGCERAGQVQPAAARDVQRERCPAWQADFPSCCVPITQRTVSRT